MAELNTSVSEQSGISGPTYTKEKQQNADLEAVCAAMSHEKGVWQREWPDLPFQVLVYLRSPEVGTALLQWPITQTLTGPSKRDFSRVGKLIYGLRSDVMYHSCLYGPQVWGTDISVSRTECHQDQWRQIFDAQLEHLEDYTPEVIVPIFDVRRAAGNAGMWNRIQPTFARNRSQEYWPAVRHGVPDITKVVKWMRLRTARDGRTLDQLFHPPIQREDGWWEFKNKSFDESRLPTRSSGPFASANAGRPDWVDRFHGCKWEALYTILSDLDDPSGGIAESALSQIHISR